MDMEEKGRKEGYARNDEIPGTSITNDAPRRRSAALKRKAPSAASISATSKRQAKERLHPSVVALHNGPCTRARQSPSKVAAPLHQKPESASSLLRNATITSKSLPVEKDCPNTDHIIEEQFETVRSRGVNSHVIPNPAGWFSWTKIHSIEEHALSSFFNGKSEKRTPEVYMAIRNAIMKRYHSDPKTQNELENLPEIIVEDPEARREILKFLDHWGLINFQPFPLSDSSEVNDSTRGVVLDKMSSLIEKLYRFEMVQAPCDTIFKKDILASSAPLRLAQESVTIEELVKSEGPAVEYHCNSCSADCSRKRYHCQRQADFDLCSDCFNDKKFSSGMVSADFILMESAEMHGINGGSWTDQETLLLLEALELYGENWNEIAEHVATKTKAQCILHFVQMPIEDPFLDDEDNTDIPVDVNADIDFKDKDSSSRKQSSETCASKEDEDRIEEKPEETTALTEDKSVILKNKAETNEENPDPSPKCSSDIKANDTNEASSECGVNFVLNALRDAFHAVGSPLEPGVSLSFAEAGNPVMSLALFLAGLVEPEVVAASARNSLNAVLKDPPGIHLAARHSFILEDPPSDITEIHDSVVKEMEIGKDDNLKKVPISESNEKNGKVFLSEKDQTDSSLVPSSKIDLTQTEILSNPIKPKDSPNIDATTPSDKRNSNDWTPADEHSAVKVKDNISHLEAFSAPTVKISDDSSMSRSGTTIGSKELETKDTHMSKALEKGSSCVIFEKTNAQSASGSDSKTDSVKQREEHLGNVQQSGSEKYGKLDEKKNINNLDRLKSAAVTALSSAAVKAQLLAKQEEDQVRHMVTFLIEKQLHKLETKLALFSDMDSVILRAKEQMDRARQKLYQERAQIITARLGLPASLPRQVQTAPPMNRAPAVNYPNTMPPKSFINAIQKPPSTNRLTKPSNPSLPGSSSAHS